MRQPVTFSDLKIRTKYKRLLPFIPNFVQSYYLDMLTPDWRPSDWDNHLQAQEEMERIRLHPMHTGDVTRIPHYPAFTLRGVREDILKFRQPGFSTLWLAIYFMDTCNEDLTQSIIMAHDAVSTEKLFKIIHRFYEYLPPDKKLKKKYSNRREIEFADTDSIIAVGMVGGTGVGRGGTINNAHLSERAFWENAEEVESGLLESVPFEGNVTRETTANGLNEYHAEYQRSKRGESRFRARFFGWNLQREYRIPTADKGSTGEMGDSGSIAGADTSFTIEEASLVASYGLDEGQIAWRREKIKDLKEKFPQEYPINDIEAFLASGNPRFNRDYLYRLLQHVRSPDLAPDRVETPDNSAWSGTVTTYAEPEEGREYLLVADVAEGLNADGKHDNSVAHIYDRSKWEQVAHYTSGSAEPHLYALDLNVLGRTYNNALVAVERNNHGHAVIEALLHVCFYDNIYYHQDYDATGTATTKAGFPSTTRSKPEAVGKLASIIEEMAEGEAGFIWRHPQTIEELIHYIKVAGGKTEAESGSNDDNVTCCWIASALMPSYSITEPLKGRTKQQFKPTVSGSNRLSRV